MIYDPNGWKSLNLKTISYILVIIAIEKVITINKQNIFLMHNATIFILYKGVFPLRETPLYSYK